MISASGALADDPGEGAKPRLNEARGAGPSSAQREPILVVDDDESILEMVRDLLELEGYLVITARGGREALQLAEMHRPALVLLDMRMPDGDGWEYAAASRQRGIDVPIVVVTAAENARKWANEIEAVGYVAKPFDVEELVQAVERHRRREARN